MIYQKIPHSLPSPANMNFFIENIHSHFIFFFVLDFTDDHETLIFQENIPYFLTNSNIVCIV